MCIEEGNKPNPENNYIGHQEHILNNIGHLLKPELINRRAISYVSQMISYTICFMVDMITKRKSYEHKNLHLIEVTIYI